VGPIEASLRERAIEARRRLFGAPVKELARPKWVEEAPASKAKLPHAKIIRRKHPRKPVNYEAQRKNASTSVWTPELVETMLRMWHEGNSGSVIAAYLGHGLTRSAICGKVWRLEHPDKAKDRAPRQRKKLPPKANKTSRSNVAANAPPAPRAVKPPSVVVGLPNRGANDDALVAGWLAQHGGPRRFERGDSATLDAMKWFLRDRGYEVTFTQKGGMALKQSGAMGRPRKVKLRELIEFVDAMRAAEGLERIAA
jgi:hypothetical protein